MSTRATFLGGEWPGDEAMVLVVVHIFYRGSVNSSLGHKGSFKHPHSITVVMDVSLLPADGSKNTSTCSQQIHNPVNKMAGHTYLLHRMSISSVILYTFVFVHSAGILHV